MSDVLQPTLQGSIPWTIYPVLEKAVCHMHKWKELVPLIASFGKDSGLINRHTRLFPSFKPAQGLQRLPQASLTTEGTLEQQGQVSGKKLRPPSNKHADFARPRLLGGDPLTRIKLAGRAAQGITDERGHEQDNTPKKMRKEKPPRGHPDRKPRHANNPRRVPDMFRVARWQMLIRLTDHHHDVLDWKKLTAFLSRTLQFYNALPAAEKSQLRDSGLLKKLRDRAEELDLRTADEQFVQKFNWAMKRMRWDPGEATTERLQARAVELQTFKENVPKQAKQALQEQMFAARRQALQLQALRGET